MKWTRRTLAATALLLALFAIACEREELPPNVPDTVAPLPPAGVVIESARDGYVFVGWLRNSEHDLAGYVLFRSREQDGPFNVLDTTARHYYIDPNCEYDSTYYYTITALDNSGNQSERSVVVSAVSRNLNDPDAPSVLTATGGNDGSLKRIRLVWQPPLAYDVSVFRIFRSINPAVLGDASTLLDSSATTVYDDASPAVGVRYYYALRSVDRGGRVSDASESVSELVTELPELLSPPDRAVLAEYPLFEWRSVPEAAEYEVTVSESPFGAPLWSSRVRTVVNSSASLRYGGPALYQGHAYYWRVSTCTRIGGAPNAASLMRLFQLI